MILPIFFKYDGSLFLFGPYSKVKKNLEYWSIISGRTHWRKRYEEYNCKHSVVCHLEDARFMNTVKKNSLVHTN